MSSATSVRIADPGTTAMRRATLGFLALMSLCGTSAPRAADLDYGVLRGPDYDEVPVAESAIDWSGVYVGGHGGYTTTNFGFGKAGRSNLAHILRSSAIEAQFNISSSNTLRAARGHDLSYGGFAGYNTQFDDIVLGIEVDYTSANQKGRSFDQLGRSVTLNGPLYDNYIISTDARSTLQDYATIRGRAGYAFGAFLPFVTGGVAVGRALVGSSVRVQVREYTDVNHTNLVGGLDESGGSLKEKYRFGATFGIGGDYYLTRNIFVRGEYQYILFGKFGDYAMNVNTVRGAVGVKF